MNKSKNKTNNKITSGKFSKVGAEARWKEHNKTRYELIQELSKLIDKVMLNHIQMSKTRWTNQNLADLIKSYKNG